MNKTLSVAKSEYMKWIFSTRMLILFCVLVFINQFSTLPLIKMSEQMACPLNIFEPFIAVSNSDVLMMIMPIVFITLISDFPKNDGNLLFCVSRTGKKSWLSGQIIFLLCAVLTFIAAVFLSTIICSFLHTDYTENWSKTVTEYTKRFPEQAQSFEAKLIPESLYYQYVPLKSALHSVLLTVMQLFSYGLIMLIFFEINHKSVGIAANVFLIVAGGALMFSKTIFKWAFPCCNAIVKAHFRKFLRLQYFEILNSYLYFSVLISALIILSFLLIRKTDFITSQEDTQ